ncbi:uncharacterized protein TM35_000212430 [Trypanosoma theileri]|uniref:Uncharacterized protein n=1 Tax=Trypanosoma theileri TaxID=67003 RepID=A0A1X0NSH3_9TRYP|nr:uncharacterized protein TM35_000212430 [Trypanosoma theileri]ORC87637.1 hypothetical protein TM35_000212430 [Trypanosoma theileri]
MFEPLRIERVPSRIQQDSVCVAFALHPNTSATTTHSHCWGSCTVTSKLDLIFHRGEGDVQQLHIPGSVEKKKRTPHFFRLSCIDASLIQGYPISSHQVVSFSFSECSNVKVEGTHRVTTAIAQHLPTVALLLHVSSAEMNVLLLRPVVQMEGKESLIRYRASVHPTPAGIRHVVVTRCGRAAFFFGQYFSEHDGQIQCYSSSIHDNSSRLVFQSVHMTSTAYMHSSTNDTLSNEMPIASSTTEKVNDGGSQRIVWVGVRNPYHCSGVVSSNHLEVELTILTNHAVSMVFHISWANTVGNDATVKRRSATCTWTTHLRSEPLHMDSENDILLQNPLSLLKRWKTTTSFARAVKEECTVKTDPLSSNRMIPLQGLSSSTSIVRGSPNGAVICVIIPNTHEGFLIGFGSTVHRSPSCEVSTAAIMIPPNVRIVDAIWVTGPLCGFLLLGTYEQGGISELFFLPLTAHTLWRIHVEETHQSFLTHRDGTLSIFSYGFTEDMFGTMQLRLSLMYCQHRDGDEDVKEVRTGLISLPSFTRLTPLPSPLHVLRLVFLTSLASWTSIHDSSVVNSDNSNGVPAGVQPTTTTIMNREDISLQEILSLLDGKDDLQLTTELMLESQLDPWLRAGTVVGVLPLRDLLREIFTQLLDDLQRTCNGTSDMTFIEDNKNIITMILSVFRGMAESLEAISLTYSQTFLQHYISDIHTLLMLFRQTVTLLGQYGAISACFTAVAYFTKAIDNGICAGKDHMNSSTNPNSIRCCPQWRVLISPLFDDAFALISSCSSLSHALLPYCSTPLQQLIWTRERMGNTPTVVDTHNGEQTRSLEEVLTLARKGTSGLAMLSVADVCCTARRLFYRDGVESARAFLSTVVDSHRRHSQEVNDLYVEYKAVDKELNTILDCI